MLSLLANKDAWGFLSLFCGNIRSSSLGITVKSVCLEKQQGLKQLLKAGNLSVSWLWSSQSAKPFWLRVSPVCSLCKHSPVYSLITDNPVKSVLSSHPSQLVLKWWHPLRDRNLSDAAGRRNWTKKELQKEWDQGPHLLPSDVWLYYTYLHNRNPVFYQYMELISPSSPISQCGQRRYRENTRKRDHLCDQALPSFLPAPGAFS